MSLSLLTTCDLHNFFQEKWTHYFSKVEYHFLSFVYNLICGLCNCSFTGDASGKESTCWCRRHKRHGFDPWAEKIPWRRKWHPTPVFFLGEPKHICKCRTYLMLYSLIYAYLLYDRKFFTLFIQLLLYLFFILQESKNQLLISLLDIVVITKTAGNSVCC